MFLHCSSDSPTALDLASCYRSNPESGGTWRYPDASAYPVSVTDPAARLRTLRTTSLSFRHPPSRSPAAKLSVWHWLRKRSLWLLTCFLICLRSIWHQGPVLELLQAWKEEADQMRRNLKKAA